MLTNENLDRLAECRAPRLSPNGYRMRQILLALSDAKAVAQVQSFADRIGVRRSTVSRCLSALTSRGLATKANGHYSLTPAGHAWVAQERQAAPPPAAPPPDRDLRFLQFVYAELQEARGTYGDMINPHEAYAVIKEELDEFWEECRKKPTKREPGALLVELIQIAAMATRAGVDLGLISDDALHLEGSY